MLKELNEKYGTDLLEFVSAEIEDGYLNCLVKVDTDLLNNTKAVKFRWDDEAEEDNYGFNYNLRLDNYNEEKILDILKNRFNLKEIEIDGKKMVLENEIYNVDDEDLEYNHYYERETKYSPGGDIIEFVGRGIELEISFKIN